MPFCVVVGCFPQPPIASEKVPARSVQKRHFRGVGHFGKCVSGRKTQPYIFIDRPRRDPGTGFWPQGRIPLKNNGISCPGPPPLPVDDRLAGADLVERHALEQLDERALALALEERGF